MTVSAKNPVDNVAIRPSRHDAERVVARSVCEAALLEVPGDPEWLVAVEDDRVLGAVALDGTAIEAVAVRPNRRGRGIGTALIEAAAERRDALVAAFDGQVLPFYQALGFDVEPIAGEPDRYQGRRR